MHVSTSSSSSGSRKRSLVSYLLPSSSTSTVVTIVVVLLVSLLLMFYISGSTSSHSSYFQSSSSSSSSQSTLVESKSVASGVDNITAGGNKIVGSNFVARQFPPPIAAPAPAPAAAPEVPRRIKKLDANLERIELGLARARSAIRQTIQEANTTLPDSYYVPKGPMYRNALAFHRSYLEMERLFKVHVYKEGDPPLFHDGPCKSIYSMEGRFIYNMEGETDFKTKDPDKAHVHFLPFSITKMVKYVYDRRTRNKKPILRTVEDYIHVIRERYPYWNRSLGADHFMLSCHDWGPYASTSMPYLYNNSIRVLCNANTSEGFNPAKDVSLPEINLKTGLTTGIIGGPSASHRPILAFFAGGLHGPIRPILIDHWKGKDNDIQVYEYLPKGISYYDMMRRSKYCLCPSGYEVASPRVVEAIYLECVPVIISDHYVLPFSDVLNWKKFSVQVAVEDIPNLKIILSSISPRAYARMQRRVKVVQRHFVVSSPPQRFDVFHMILHSIWLRRMNIRIHPQL